MSANNTVQGSRPQRVRTADFAGQQVSLDASLAAYTRLDALGQNVKPAAHVLLGATAWWGVALPEFLPQDAPVYIVEEPSILAAAAMALPQQWQRVEQEKLAEILAMDKAALWWHGQNTRLKPEFWEGILGEILAHGIKGPNEGLGEFCQKKPKTVLLGVEEGQLLERELVMAFEELGYRVRVVRRGGFSAPLSKGLPENLQEDLEDAALFFSVNLQGLDVGGHDAALLKALQVPLALWFVDNPWHVLASLRLPWWKRATLLVVDAFFIPSLQREGAQKVLHIPLATAQHMWSGLEGFCASHVRNAAFAVEKAAAARLVFVGRAAFPAKQAFFAAARVPEPLLVQAREMLEAGQGAMPDFHWWSECLGAASFWPNKAVRCAGLGAEESAQYQRVLWIGHMLKLLGEGMVVFGDTASWRQLLGVEPAHSTENFYDAVDYYGALAAVYAAAPAVFNVTSLLLPWGLTQRHFDVWAAGGFLWTNETRGLDIFPAELVRPMAATSVRQLQAKMQDMSVKACEDLRQGWREHLLVEHSYTRRMKQVLEAIF